MNTRLSPLAIILLAGLLGVAFALSIVNPVSYTHLTLPTKA